MSASTQIENFDHNIAIFVAGLNGKFASTGTIFTTQVGQRYTRVVTAYAHGAGGNAYCFVERATGDVLKAAGWKAPAKGARGSIATAEAMAGCITRADEFGGWLYR